MRKKTIIILIASFLFPAFITEAQVEVVSDGTVRVGADNFDPGDKDFTVVDVQNNTVTSNDAYSSMRMDNVNNYLLLNRKGFNYRNEIVWYSANFAYWRMGLNDSDDTPNSNLDNFYIGKNIGGSSPYIWLDYDNYENTSTIGLFTRTPDPAYKLTLNGAALAYEGIWKSSDIDLKQNINRIESSIEKLLTIRGVTYEYNTEYEALAGFEESNSQEKMYTDSTGTIIYQQDKEKSNPLSKNRYGVIAQEVMEQFPDLVHKGSNGYYAVNYDGLIPVLIEAIKEQQNTIEKIQDELNGLRESNLKSLSTNLKEDIVLTPTLFQNSPNPFSESTIIKYNLPEAIEKAFIIVYDMNGKQIKNIALSTWGESQVSIAAGEFDAGMYLYSLLVDDQLIDTKQMVLIDK